MVQSQCDLGIIAQSSSQSISITVVYIINQISQPNKIPNNKRTQYKKIIYHNNLIFIVIIIFVTITMKKLITTVNDFNPLTRALKSVNINCFERYRMWKQMRAISNQQILFNHIENAHKYSDDLSYSCKLFDFTEVQNLHRFGFYSDQAIGGDSTGTLYFDGQRRHFVIEGMISDKDKDKLVNFPSIGMTRCHDYPINCGPFNAINIEIQSDGHPIHVGVQIKTQVNGTVACFGIITSKLKGWRNFQLPFANMILVGAQQSSSERQDYYLNTTGSGTVVGQDKYDMRRIISTQTDKIILCNINFRLLSSKSIPRKIGLRNITLIRRAQSARFINEYHQPFFYQVDPEPYVVQKNLGISWLTKGYQHFSNIDLGDKKYTRRSDAKN